MIYSGYPRHSDSIHHYTDHTASGVHLLLLQELLRIFPGNFLLLLLQEDGI